MRDRHNLVLMERLLTVQRVRQAASEGRLAAARHRETQAKEEEAKACEARNVAESHWFDHLSKPGFAPEYGRALSAMLLARERDASQATQSAEQCTQIALEREKDWQHDVALTRNGELTTKRLHRKVERKREDHRLVQLGDRLAADWARR
jgi:hypothetical protein